MGKLFVTNNMKWKRALLDEFSESGFRVCGNDNELVSFHKLNMENVNYYKEGEDCVACAGTFFYKEELGEEALKSFLADAKEIDRDSILDLRNNAVGMYVIVARIGGVTYVFVDDENLYQFFYYHKNGEYLLTNTIYHIAQQTESALDIEEMYKYISVRGYYDNAMYFEDVYKLEKDDLIVIQNSQFELRKCSNKINDIVIDGFEKTANKLEENLRDIIRIRKKHINKSILFLTGGVDSRLEYAMYVGNGENVKVGYWLGKDMITNGRKEDAKISRTLADLHGNDFELFDVSEDLEDGLEAIDRKLCNKYGEWAAIYANNTKWKKIFENLDKDIDFINFGAMAEPLRESYHFDKEYKPPYTFEQFIQDEFCMYNVSRYIFRQDSDYIHSVVGEAVKRRFVTSEMDLSNLTFADCARLVAEKWYALEDGVYNFANMFCYSFPTLGMRRIHDMAVPMDYHYKLGSKLSIELTKRFCNDLLDVPYFSAHCCAKLNRKTGKITSSLFSRVRRKIIPIFADSWFFQKIVVDVIGHMIWPHMRDDESIMETNSKYLKNSKTIEKNEIQVYKPDSMMHVDVSVYSQTVAYFMMLDQLINE